MHLIGNEQCTFYRLNGDEFVCVLTDLHQLEDVRSKLLGVFKESFTFVDYEFYSSVSIGYSLYPDHAETVTDLLKCADLAMYAAKKKHSNTCVEFSAQLNDFNDNVLMLETKLHQALRDEAFILHYQPKINIQTSEMEGMEALIRWHDKELGFVRPDQFIPFAEECGLIINIGKWVLRTAGLQVKAWNEQFGLQLRVAVNISPRHLDEPDFVSHLENLLQEIDLNPAFLEIEITEVSMMEQSAALIEKMNAIQRLGVTISVDDFGTGYSSLSYLQKMPINTLKIDRSFIQNISNEQTGVAMVEAIIKLAHALNLSVVAEGVEEEHELEVLKHFDCEYVQGYLFSRPLPIEQFTEKLQSIQV